MANYLAIDIGGTNTKIAIIKSSGKVGVVTTTLTDGMLGIDNYLNQVVQEAKELISKERHAIEGIGIAVAGFVDAAHTRMTYNPNIAWLENAPFGKYISSKLDLPFYIEIDSNAAALAEAVYGNGRDSNRLLVLTIGTGLGGGMTVDREILRISNECLGDIGHVIVEPGGPHCAAGCKGCAEAMVSSSALERYYLELVEPNQNLDPQKPNNDKIMSAYEIIRSAQSGNQVSIKAIQKLGRYLGIALASMTPIFAPDKVCISGGISEAGDILIDSTRSYFLEIAGSPYTKGVTIEKAKLGWQSVLVGAAVAYQKSKKSILR